MSPAQMWASYHFRGHRVTVVQQWRDPFGRAMVRIQLAGREGEQAGEQADEQADGLPEDDFMREAVELPVA